MRFDPRYVLASAVLFDALEALVGVGDGTLARSYQEHRLACST